MSTQLRRTAATIRTIMFREAAHLLAQDRPAPEKPAKAGRVKSVTDPYEPVAAARK